MPNSTPEHLHFLSFARELADEASTLALDYFQRLATLRADEGGARRKADGTLVTRADEEIDRLLTRQINGRFPDHGVLSEEQTTRYDPSHRYTWVIDPIDGTTNYARGLPLWGISIALLEHGAPVVGVIDFPAMRERFSAVRHGSATRNGKVVQTDSHAELDNIHLLTQCSRTQRRYRVDVPLKRRLLGSVTVHLTRVAAGSALAAIEATPKVWDLAAAALVLEEAGGALSLISGDQLFPLDDVFFDYANKSLPTVAAANQSVLSQMRAGVSARDG